MYKKIPRGNKENKTARYSSSWSTKTKLKWHDYQEKENLIDDLENSSRSKAVKQKQIEDTIQAIQARMENMNMKEVKQLRKQWTEERKSKRLADEDLELTSKTGSSVEDCRLIFDKNSVIFKK